jgi:two-component system sensor kinase FixL
MAHLSRLQAMGTMASTLAHELNQPLAAVVNYISGSRRLLGPATDPDAERIAEAMRSAEDCAMRAGKIIRKVREQVSRNVTSQAPESVARLIDEACSIALINAKSLGIRTQIDLDPKASTVLVDAVQAQQILINFLRNAVDAVSTTDRRRITITSRLDGEFCAISVNDSGPGIAPDMVAKLFEPFASDKADGVGIGLSISRTIAESHGGRIEHGTSSLGGACFTVKLPLGNE